VSRNSIKLQNLPETIIWYYIIGTYPIYFIGVQYVATSLLVAFLTFYLMKKWWNQTEETPGSKKIIISPSTWIWLVAVLVIEFALIIGHLNFHFGISEIIKASLNLYRGWGLFALFTLVGHLNIRPKLIYRAVCILCFQTIFVVLIGTLANLLHLPSISYTSPLSALGGGVLPNSVQVFQSVVGDLESNRRLQLFTPWPPALGMVGDVFFCLTCQETNKKWRGLGMVGAVTMIVGSVSRLAIVGLPIVLLLVWFLTNFARPYTQFIAGSVSFITAIFYPKIVNLLETFKEQFNKVRSGSSEVRGAIQNMTRERWWNEAPIWGHGHIENRGPAALAFMPLGSHHTWFSILYTQGLVGCIALAMAFLWSFLDLLLKAQTYEHAKVGLSIILIVLLFSFGENVDTFAYTYWPGIVILGIAFKQEPLSIYKTDKQFRT
jgi:uncharacterized membrane protein